MPPQTPIRDPVPQQCRRVPELAGCGGGIGGRDEHRPLRLVALGRAIRIADQLERGLEVEQRRFGRIEPSDLPRGGEVCPPCLGKPPGTLEELMLQPASLAGHAPGGGTRQ